MIISLIGMSGVGKTHWSKKLEEIGWVRFCVDDLIGLKLEKELKSTKFADTQDVSLWMGQPYDERYSKTSKIYLDYEIKSMEEIFKQIKKIKKNKNVVIDTTGSVIYLGEKIISNLSKLSKIIYLQITPSIQKQMYELYLKDPKPVLWGDIYRKFDGETDKQALGRCYSQLLEYRLKKYQKHAHQELDYHKIRKVEFSIKDFLNLIF